MFLPPTRTWQPPSRSAVPPLCHSCLWVGAVLISTRASLLVGHPLHLEEELPDGGDPVLLCFSHLQPGFVHSRQLTFANCVHKGNNLRLDVGTAGTLRPSVDMAVT